MPSLAFGEHYCQEPLLLLYIFKLSHSQYLSSVGLLCAPIILSNGLLGCCCYFRYKTDIEKYKEKVKESIEACRQATLNPDPSDPHSVK